MEVGDNQGARMGSDSRCVILDSLNPVADGMANSGRVKRDKGI